MLAECSGVGASIDVTRVPRPDGVSLERWLQTFPSFGFLLAVPACNVAAVLALFSARGIAAANIGTITEDERVEIIDGRAREVVWDFSRAPLIGCRRAEAAT
jgi:selenophosphate synthetase-related protein